MAATGTRQEDPHLRGSMLWARPDDQQCGVLILGSRRADVFVATNVLLFAGTLGAEEAVRGWLAQHGVEMTPTKEIPTGHWGRDGVEQIASEPAKAKASDDGRKD